MIKLLAHNEQNNSFDTEVHIEGEGGLVIKELTSIFNGIYEASPFLFERALVDSNYTEDHT